MIILVHHQAFSRCPQTAHQVKLDFQGSLHLSLEDLKYVTIMLGELYAITIGIHKMLELHAVTSAFSSFMVS